MTFTTRIMNCDTDEERKACKIALDYHADKYKGYGVAKAATTYTIQLDVKKYSIEVKNTKSGYTATCTSKHRRLMSTW